MEAPEYFSNDFCRGGNQHCAPEKKGGGDQFIVEDLLDFSNEEEEDEVGWVVGGSSGGDEGGSDGAAGNSTDSSTVTAVDSCSNSFSGLDPHFPSDLVCRNLADSIHSGELCEPQYDEIAELEWLSNFVEESFSSEDLHKLHLINGVSSSSSSSSTVAPKGAEVSAAAAACRVDQVASFRPEAPVPGKARSKRSRAAPCNWSSRLLVLSPPPSAASSPDSELIVPPNASASAGSSSGGKKTASKKKDPSAGPALVAAPDGRKCLHCQTDKTPQWRTGPMGPKTLCNACGVRYKSGRLVPEYRPAASPTFVFSQHSNSHRKVLELRRQKELQLQQQQQHLHTPGPGPLYDAQPPVSAAGFLLHAPDMQHLI
ncbi:GATA transcription factor 9-like isoform X1 [Canna indica]|uniref:GATA transcription factor n=1 Tax=Canna indica TaxID=4628 RepID=A0AAQ3L536_9LILI|nr:GATA transcription factor 9-like isoform X1 [Canna indica]